MKRLGIILFHIFVIGILAFPWIMPGTVTHQYLGDFIPPNDGKILRTIEYDGNDVCGVTYPVKIKRTDGSIYEKRISVETRRKDQNTFFERELLNNKKVYNPNIRDGWFFLRILSGFFILVLIIRDIVMFNDEGCDCIQSCGLSGLCKHSRKFHKILQEDSSVIKMIYISTKPYIRKFFGYD